jgi:ribosomal protein S18 acetylase RimI-like enzyme
MVLERDCFDADRRDTRSTVRNSIVNHKHEIWVESAFPDQRIGVAVFLRRVRATLRIYSLSTHPDLRGQGWGNHLLRFAKERARTAGCRQLSLEADASLPALVDWYERNGFHRVKLLESYYDTNRHAWRMKCPVEPSERCDALIAGHIECCPHDSP